MLLQNLSETKVLQFFTTTTAWALAITNKPRKALRLVAKASVTERDQLLYKTARKNSKKVSRISYNFPQISVGFDRVLRSVS